MKPYLRTDRISVRIQSSITDLLNKKIQDPRLEMVTVSGVKLSKDLQVALVFITVFGDKKKVAEALEGFKKSKGYIKKHIAPKLGLKHMPELKFVYDDSFDKGARMDALIKSAMAECSNNPEEDDSDSLPDNLSDLSDN